MNTITFEKELSFTRSKFKDEKDFFIYVLENHKIQDEKIEIWLLNESEKTTELLNKIKKAKASKIYFNNI